MSSHRILITGASGYLGGTLLARWKGADLPAYDKLYALVRTDAQAKAVGQAGAEPLTFDSRDEAAVRKAVVDNKITIVYYLIDAIRSEAQVNFIKALAEVKKATGQEVHFLHVSTTVIVNLAHVPCEQTDEVESIDNWGQDVLVPRRRAHRCTAVRHGPFAVLYPQGPGGDSPVRSDKDCEWGAEPWSRGTTASQEWEAR